MAKKNYTPNPDGMSSEDRALNTFADLMIEKITNMQQDWKKPWFSPQIVQPPRNLSGRVYNGMNSLILMMMQEKKGWQTSRYATFDRIAGLNFTKDKDGKRTAAVDKDGNKLPHVSILKGERSTPVMLTTFNCVHAETKERIKYDDYKQLGEADKVMYHVYPKMQVFNVFNIDQTNLKESRPEMYQSYLDEVEGRMFESAEGMRNFPALDAMIEKDLYVCPIKPTRGDDAYYSLSKDMIVIPEKEQFIDGESFYSNLLHEMGHATGAPSRLDRLKSGQGFGNDAYAKEELVAELTAALVSTQYGMEKHVKSDSAAYLKSWLGSLHEDPSFIKAALLDVKRASSFISQRIDAVNMKLERDGWDADFSEIRKQNKAYTPPFTNKTGASPTSSQDAQPVKVASEALSESKEEIAAKGVNLPRFHR